MVVLRVRDERFGKRSWRLFGLEGICYLWWVWVGGEHRSLSHLRMSIFPAGSHAMYPLAKAVQYTTRCKDPKGDYPLNEARGVLHERTSLTNERSLHAR